jgi:hypothetical protein
MRLLFLILLLILPTLVFAQDTELQENIEHSEEHKFHHHKLAVIIGHSHISQGFVDEGRKWRVLPAWEFAYSYSFNEKWFIALTADLILEDFEVEHNSGDEEEIILREKPFAPAIEAGYRITKHSSFMIGAGAEFASGDTFFLTRITYEWATEINDKWELVIPLTYDLRWDAYDIWNLGIGVARMF